MGKGVEIPYIEGVKIPCLGGRYTMGMVTISRIGVNIFLYRGFKISWGSIYKTYHFSISGFKIPWIKIDPEINIP